MTPLRDDLETVFRDIAATVPRLSTDDDLVFSRDNLPSPPPELSTDALWFCSPNWHIYNNYPVPMIDLNIGKSGCRLLGLLILAVVFHPEPETVELHLRHRHSQIDLLRVRHEQTSWGGYYTTIPDSFSYFPYVLEKYPWFPGQTDRTELPMIEITTRDELGLRTNSNDVLGECDTVIGFGHDRSAVRMAELLLDASLDDSDHVEYDLEGELGYTGVGVGSAELRIRLPGGMGYHDLDDEDPRPGS